MLFPDMGWRTSSPGVTIQNSSPGFNPRSTPAFRYNRLCSVKSVCSALFSAPMTWAMNPSSFGPM